MNLIGRLSHPLYTVEVQKGFCGHRAQHYSARGEEIPLDDPFVGHEATSGLVPC